MIRRIPRAAAARFIPASPGLDPLFPTSESVQRRCRCRESARPASGATADRRQTRRYHTFRRSRDGAKRCQPPSCNAPTNPTVNHDTHAGSLSSSLVALAELIDGSRLTRRSRHETLRVGISWCPTRSNAGSIPLLAEGFGRPPGRRRPAGVVRVGGGLVGVEEAAVPRSRNPLGAERRSAWSSER